MMRKLYAVWQRSEASRVADAVGVALLFGVTIVSLWVMP